MHSLLLHCSAPLWRPASPCQVARVLEEIGLTGLVQDESVGVYAAGEHFLTLVTFLGCSPQVSLTESAAVGGQPLCRIRLHDFETLQLLQSRPAPALRCAACRAPQPRPSSLEYDLLLTCAKCGESALLSRYDWRRGAAFGCFFIEIENVFPHEAVPADRLMSVLEGLSDNQWDYFYLSR